MPRPSPGRLQAGVAASGTANVFLPSAGAVSSLGLCYVKLSMLLLSHAEALQERPS